MKDYTQYDYQALVDRMTNILRDKDGWGDAYQSSTGQTLIQLIADTTDHLHYMLERRTLESFLDTAKLRSSIIARASELGYRIRRVRGHRGYVTLTIVNDAGDPIVAQNEIIIPARTEIKYENSDRKFFVEEGAAIPVGGSSVEVKIREGVITTQEFDLPSGEEVFFQDFSMIDEDIFSVYSGGEEYQDVVALDDVNKRALSFLKADEAGYDIKFEVGGMRVEFGDNDFGKTPNNPVIVTYSKVEQVGDPILSIGGNFSFVTPITDTQDPSITYKSTLKNSTAITGGSSEESLESIKKNAVLYHKTNGRAVTNDDYAYWVLRSGLADIVDLNAYGEEELESLVYNTNNVYLTYATSTGSKLSTQQQLDIRNYLNKIKTSQAHIVLNQARNVQLRTRVDIKKYKNAPVSNAQAYKIARDFLADYFKIRQGSIGGFFHVSDLVNAFYALTIDRNGVKYPLVDYMKVTADGVLPFDFPPKTGECFVEINPAYNPNAGDQFILSFANLVCMTTVESGDNIKDILLKMRDVVSEATPFAASVQLSGVALDVFGNPQPIEISPKIGYHLLIGVDTPYLSNTELVKPATIGSSIIGVATFSPALTINHFYYSSRAGRRPMIPLRVGTTVSFTAPTDTAVRVYKRTDATDAGTEELVTTLSAGSVFSEVYNDQHVLIFDYVNDSSEDVVATIVYPDYTGVTYGLNVKATDNFGTFSVVTTSGDLASFVSVDYKLQMPVPDYSALVNTRTALLPSSIHITDVNGNILMSDDGSGNFVDITTGLRTTGKLNYKNGQITLPKTLPGVTPVGKYLVIFDQDMYDNLSVGSGDVIQAILPALTAEDIPTMSTLIVS